MWLSRTSTLTAANIAVFSTSSVYHILTLNTYTCGRSDNNLYRVTNSAKYAEPQMETIMRIIRIESSTALSE
jgi:hypothetical protein